ncbi:MAG: VOC family protein [Deltaproteobacteria bacterium]|nr:VOC family protein [Deltaproteobacteria bacterium]
MKRIRIQALDHIVLNVRDIDRSLNFYTETLGLKPERLDEFKAGKVGFPSVRITDDTIIDLFPIEGPAAGTFGGEKVAGNLNHFCMVIGTEDFSGIVEYLKEKEIPIRAGPVSRWGARGRATSVYFLDPDGNEVELRCY